MHVRHLGFVFLVWFPGALHAQSREPCPAPSFNRGYFLPEQATYFHKETLRYSCDSGFKPAVEGWWATSTCHNGEWSHEPQCIDEKSCFPPTIPHGKYTENQNGWFEQDDILEVTCDKGYELDSLSKQAPATCTSGSWSSLPVCERSVHACTEPPKIPHAVVVNQSYQEVFAADSEVQYECEAGYTTDGQHATGSVTCTSGNWTEGPKCNFFCVMRPAWYGYFQLYSAEYVKEGEMKSFQCAVNYSIFYGCTNKQLFHTNCCHNDDIARGIHC